VFVHGSPRKNGNTKVLTMAAMEAAKEANASVSEINAISLKHKKPGCTGCEGCDRADQYRCVLKDEVGETVASLSDYDVICFGAPIYIWSFPAQLKIFLDRMYSLLKFTESGDVESNLAGKTIALLSTAGGSYSANIELVEQQLKQFSDVLGCTFMSTSFAEVRVEPGAIADNDEAMAKAKEFGKRLAQR
jgi:multimeric flavodoxin WrbA